MLLNLHCSIVRLQTLDYSDCWLAKILARQIENEALVC